VTSGRPSTTLLSAVSTPATRSASARARAQEAVMAFMDVVEKVGANFAFPTRTLRVIDDDGALDHSADAPSQVSR
jgi:hypothetical protein